MLESVNVLAELEALAIDFDYSSAKSIKVRCPFHNDESPSLVFFLESSRFECKVCNQRGDIADYLARLAGARRSEVALLLMQKYNITKGEKTISAEMVEQCHQEIWEAGVFLQALRDRCVKDETIRRYRIGVHQKRISIPVMDLTGSVFVNIRRYLPGAKGADKMKNLRGKGKLRLYPHDQLHFDKILLCGGEIKAIAAAQELNTHGIGCIAATGGEGEWLDELTIHLAGKEVYVCFDIDAKGQRATTKICRRLFAAAKRLHTVSLPLDLNDYPTGDINDYLAQGKQLRPLIDEAKIFDPRLRLIDWSEGVYSPRSIAESLKAENIGERSAVSCLITGVQEQRYSVPKEVQIDCMLDDKCCGQCPVAVMDKDTFSIASENPAMIAMVGATDDALQFIAKKAVGIPTDCKRSSAFVLARTTAQVCVVSPPLELTASSQSSQSMQKVIALCGELEPNESYSLQCRTQPDPGSQESVLLCSNATPTLSSLQDYAFDSANSFEVFQPAEWTADSIREKLSEIYLDFEVNVTQIKSRPDLHMAIDLTYHSPLMLQFDKTPERGWIETLIIGDSSQGKTIATTRLQKHFSLGHKVDMKNASVAGLVGGLAQVGNLWVVLWGALPLHDQRLLILEELKGAATEVLSALTEVRSSGIAAIDKIKSGRRLARTRLIALSNPRSDRPMNTYSFGVDAVKELCGAPEDVRRFDLVIAVAKGDLSADVIHDLDDREIPHQFTSSKCHELLMWCWTRSVKQIDISKETRHKILDASKILCKEYSEQVPLIDAGSIRYKIARLATALAGRTFSTDDQDTLLVRPCHVEVIVDWLRKVYNSPAMKYDQFSKREHKLGSIEDPAALAQLLNAVPHSKHFYDHLINTSVFNVREISAQTGLDTLEADGLIAQLLRLYAIAMRGQQFVLTAGFRRFLENQFTPDEKREAPNGQFADRRF